ncbi:MAG: hypothetical protein K0R17_4027 [Rariglobus sp.]|jgi:uncharacterized membrane protein YqjE|nr:hypothetical protein [Rariglobus sp.]
MDDRPPPSPGFIASIAGLGENLIKTLQERVELVSIELQEEKYRMIQILIWIGAAVFAGGMTLSFATLTIVYLFWETARLAVLTGFTVFYGAVLVWVILTLRRTLTHPKPFEATIENLSEDREWLRKQT